MKHIIDDKADIVNLNNEELYLAGRLYNLEPFAMEQYNGGKWSSPSRLYLLLLLCSSFQIWTMLISLPTTQK